MKADTNAIRARRDAYLAADDSAAGIAAIREYEAHTEGDVEALLSDLATLREKARAVVEAMGAMTTGGELCLGRHAPDGLRDPVCRTEYIRERWCVGCEAAQALDNLRAALDATDAT